MTSVSTGHRDATTINTLLYRVSTQLVKPGEEIFDVIRYFGSRRKIFNVHFHNIEGGFLNFRETFIDNGSVDPAARPARAPPFAGGDESW